MRTMGKLDWLTTFTTPSPDLPIPCSFQPIGNVATVRRPTRWLGQIFIDSGPPRHIRAPQTNRLVSWLCAHHKKTCAIAVGFVNSLADHERKTLAVRRYSETLHVAQS